MSESQPRPQKRAAQVAIDSALWLGIGSAVCYGVGYLSDLRDMREAAVPRHLLPEITTQGLIFAGAGQLFVLAAIGLLIGLVGLAVSLCRPAWSKRIGDWARGRHRQHPWLVGSIMAFVAVAVVYLTTRYLHLPGSQSLLDRSPAVLELELTSGKPAEFVAGCVFLAHRDDTLVFKRERDGAIVLVPERDVSRLIVGPTPNPPSPWPF
jgi:hypothetical protein